MNPKTYSAKRDDLEPRWYLIDAEGQILGRVATQAATILRGKHKPTFTPHMLTGDFVVVINAEKVAVTGKRLDQKIYYRHSQYPGGLKQETLRQVLAKHPERAIERAVKGMLPKNRLADQMLHRLKVYAGSRHPHQGQQPVPWTQPKAEAAPVAQEQSDTQEQTESAEA